MPKLEFTDHKVCAHTLSANEIRQFTECPRKRYYSSRDCLAIRETKKNANLELGKAFHMAIGHYYVETQKKLAELIGDRKPTKEEVDNAFLLVDAWDLPEGLVLSPDDEKMLWCMVDNYMLTLKRDLVEYKIIQLELEIQMLDWPVPDCMYHGQIDMVVQSWDDGKYYFFEHKTCKAFRPDIYSRFDIQLHIYGTYGATKFAPDNFGGMILNQIKKAKTVNGYGESRDIYTYSIEEINDFFSWIKAKTEECVSPSNKHAPCNNFMTCKMCPYAAICMKYGYEIPKTTEEITKSDFFTEVDEDNNIVPMYSYDPREEEGGED